MKSIQSSFTDEILNKAKQARIRMLGDLSSCIDGKMRQNSRSYKVPLLYSRHYQAGQLYGTGHLVLYIRQRRKMRVLSARRILRISTDGVSLAIFAKVIQGGKCKRGVSHLQQSASLYL